MSVNRPSEEENERFNNSEDSAENTDSSAHSSQSNADEGVSLPPPPPPRGQRRERLEKEQQEKIREEYEKRHGLGEWSASEEETSAEKPSITKNATSLPPLGGNEEGNDDGTESIDDEEGLSDDTDDGIKSTEQFDDTETVVDYANIAPASHESVGNDDPQSTQVIVQPPESGNETLPELSEATDTEASRDDLNAALAGAMHQKYEKDKQLLQDQDPEEAHPEKKGKKTKIITAIIVILILAVGAMVTWWLTSENNDDDEVLDSSPVETENTEAPEEEEEEEVEMVVVPEAEPLGPEQTEIDESAICEPFIDVGLECSVSEEFDDEDEIERGEIISQSVEAGEEAEVETEIEVVYSAGPESSTMPEIYNEPVDETVGRLYELGVDIEDTVYEEGSNLREDNVISASVEAEETVEAGDTVENGALVTLTVSDGTVEVPDWTEELQETVEEESAELNVSVELEAEESEETAGTVLSQSDVGIVDFDSEITVNIAVPFENVPLEIPDVVDESPELAQSDLSEVGFRNITSVTVPSGEVDEPTVTQVVPGVGSTGMSEEQVVLIVSEPIDEDSDEEN